MKFLVIGLGSMGKRRVRCLQSLGYSEIVGFDVRADRRAEAEQKYGIKTVGLLDSSQLEACDAVIVSTPPNLHAMWGKRVWGCRYATTCAFPNGFS